MMRDRDRQKGRVVVEASVSEFPRRLVYKHTHGSVN
jgi:hypothetical protein